MRILIDPMRISGGPKGKIAYDGISRDGDTLELSEKQTGKKHIPDSGVITKQQYNKAAKNINKKEV